MKRDPHISKLIREAGVESAPVDFTSQVMDKIAAIPVNKAYKPLIGRRGRIIMILVVIAVIVLAVLYTDPTGELFGSRITLPQVERQLPRLNLNLDFFKQLNLSTGIVSALVALFVLVLSDAGLNRRKLI